MTRAAHRRPYLGWIVGLTLLAFLIRVTGIWANLPDVPNPDEFKLVWPPLRMAYGNWRATGGYPPLYACILLLEYGLAYGLGSLAGWYSGTMDFATKMLADPIPLYLMGRTTSVLLGTATVPLLYGVGRRLYDGRVGLLAAAFLAVDTVHVYASQVVKNDVLMVFLLVSSFWFCCGILREGRSRDYALAGLLVGLAGAAKYNAILGVLPILIAHVLHSRRRGRSWPQMAFARPLWLAGLCSLAGFLLGYPHFLLDPRLALEGLRTNSTGFFWAWLGWEGVPLGWIYYPAIALNTAWGLPLQLLALGGLVAAFVHHKPEDLLLAVMPLANYLVMGPVRVNQPRYFLLAMPFLLVLAAKLLVDGWRTFLPRVPDSLRQPVAVLGLFVFLVWPVAASLAQDYMLLQPDPRVSARNWIEEHVPSGSRIVLDLGGPALMASPESQLAASGPALGRFEELRRDAASRYSPNYWIEPIRHYLSGPSYQAGREADVHSLKLYQAQGFEYVVLSTLPYDAYLRWPGVAERYPRTLAFYREVSQGAHLLAEFVPVLGDPRDFAATDLNPIPTISVYRLD